MLKPSIIFLSLIVITAQSTQSKTLVLDELILEAIKKNSSLLQTQYLSDAMKAKIGPASSYPDPKITYNHSNFPVNSLASDKFNMTGKEISLEQKISFPGKLTQKKNVAKFSHHASQHAFQEKYQNVIFDVKTAYYDLYYLSRKLSIFEENLNVVRQFKKLIKARYKTGRGSQSQAIKVNLRFIDLKIEIISLKKNIQIKEADLNVLLNREAHVSLGTPPEFLEIQIFNFNKFNMNFLYHLALRNNPEFFKYRSKIQSADAEVAFNSLNHFPDFTFGAKYRFRDATAADSSGNDFISASIGLTLPIFFFSKQKSQKREALARKNAAIAQKIYSEKLLSHHIHHTLLTVKEMSAFLKIYKDEVLPQSNQALNSSRAGYRVGSINFSTLMTSEKQHFSYRTKYEEILSRYFKGIASIEKNVGQSIDQW